MGYQQRVQKNIEVFEDTRQWYTADPALQRAVQRSTAGTVLYAPGALRVPQAALDRFAASAAVTVTGARTLQAAGRWRGARVAVLNFASATNPGGGVERGSSAQEESLCRCSTLYPCLCTPELWQGYYQFPRRRADARYTAPCIYTPDVLVIKTDDENPARLPAGAWQAVDVVTCAAPNLRPRPYNAMNPGTGAPVQVGAAELGALHEQRARKILSAAALHGAEVVILGAFGCGAFCNPPEVVAAAYRRVLPEFSHAFRAIEFAVYCPPSQPSENFRVFREILT